MANTFVFSQAVVSVAVIVSCLGVAFGLGRVFLGPKPSLATRTSLGVLAGIAALWVGIALSLFMLYRWLGAAGIVMALILSIVVFLTSIRGHVRRHHPTVGATVTSIGFGIFAIIVLGWYVGLMVFCWRGSCNL